jgi:predicted HAD superfamily phosphohydrolase
MIQLNIDCEGPLTLNDNAFELCREFIPEGDKFFARVSKYDDYLADIENKTGYKAGDTLKLILPFLIAHDVKQETIRDFSLKNLFLLSGTKEMLPKLSKEIPVYIISTSYQPYLSALALATGFSEDNIFCTDIELDNYKLSDEEKNQIKAITRQIIELPLINLEDIYFISDIKGENKKIIEKMNDIFWNVIPQMPIGKAIYNDVNPVGGIEKAEAVLISSQKTGNELKNCIYIGDSITDVQALSLIKNNHGLSISFNGNDYALKAADYAISGDSFELIYNIVMLANEKGISFIRQNAESAQNMLKEMATDEKKQRDYLLFSKITQGNFEDIKAKSQYFRKVVRGVAISDLG